MIYRSTNELEKKFDEYRKLFGCDRRTFATNQLTIETLKLARWAGVEADELAEDVTESLALGLHRPGTKGGD